MTARWLQPPTRCRVWSCRSGTHFQSGNHDAARAAQESLRPLRDAFALGTLPVVLKTATQLLNVPVGPCRAPVQPLDAAALEKLHSLLAVYRQA
ncbi:dihydrodipicolinate synthase family protein [Pseudomonas syringae]|uniref:dihydrodipicolinate synthase family protein n=1 Tax=Pseudomonas syringae TaxID=317 RepID=UPI0023AA800F|nr:dihydrodipicolinate synthase family protein [Pseudomonas syringae]